ncbi:NRAMP family [Gorgonomyces haynaldii]|nr:NRAMP family [Gorgonomyces haynaldii]
MKNWTEFFKTLASFIGPGYMVAVGYLDPGNWATDLAAGSQFGYKLLFVILLSNFMAIILQSLCVRLGVVTGYDLAQACRQHFSKPVWVILYLLAEVAIVATDLAEVIGSAIAMQLLFGLPLVWGVLITVFDVLLLLLGWGKHGNRYFEAFVILLVLSTAGCLFAVMAQSQPVAKDVFMGYLPSTTLVTNTDALLLAIGIIGATVMPHNLYLHSSIVKDRAFDSQLPVDDFENNQALLGDTKQSASRKEMLPTLLKMTQLDSMLALMFALIVNSSILIVSASNFYVKGVFDVAEIQDAFRLIGENLGHGVAVLFALGLLFAGQSSTMTGTIAGQIVMDGFLGGAIKLKPWMRRLLTRMLSVIPAMVAILAYGDSGLSKLLIVSQVVLSFQLPFAVWPLFYFVTSEKIMTVSFESDDASTGFGLQVEEKDHYHITGPFKLLAFLVAFIISGLNIYLLVSTFMEFATQS